MATEIQVLDAIPGSGKTSAIFKYIAKNPNTNFIYLSPMLSEVHERVTKECEDNNIAFSVPAEDSGNKAKQVLDFLSEGENIACTHALTLYFTKEHINLIKSKKYTIICDEELDLIEAYNISKEDVEFLYSKNLLAKDINNFGRLTFLDENMPYETRYGDIKRLCDRGCLYGEKNSDTMLVTYLSPDLIIAAEEFILLTHNFGGTVMDAFLKLHDITFTSFSLSLHRSQEECKEKIRSYLDFCETTNLKKFHRQQTRYTLSSTWWKSNSPKRKEDIKNVRNIIRASIRTFGTAKEDVFYTLPKDSIQDIKNHNISGENYVQFNCRATNMLRHKKHAIHAYNVFVHGTVKSYLSSYGFEVDEDAHALNALLQWLYRGCIRDGNKMKVTILSARMKGILLEWLK